MWTKRNGTTLILLLVALLLGTVTAIPLLAQTDEAISIRLRRNVGTDLGGSIQGRFTILVDAPASIRFVTFYLDDVPIGTDTEAPFQLRFNTDNYETGMHTIVAVGTNAAGAEIRSNQLSRNFLSGGAANRIILWIIIPILVVSLGGRLVTNWIANRGRGKRQVAISGPMGGTICPHCERPYALHIWKLNILIGALDRCPHCGKWRIVRRVPIEQLQEAADAMADTNKADDEAAATDMPAEPDSLKKRLDDSRFDDAA